MKSFGLFVSVYVYIFSCTLSQNTMYFLFIFFFLFLLFSLVFSFSVVPLFFASFLCFAVCYYIILFFLFYLISVLDACAFSSVLISPLNFIFHAHFVLHSNARTQNLVHICLCMCREKKTQHNFSFFEWIFYFFFSMLLHSLRYSSEKKLLQMGEKRKRMGKRLVFQFGFQC